MATGLTEASDLVLEDGTGVATANSYMSIADVGTYVNLRQDANLLPWVNANESNHVAALIIATQYVDLRWKFEGIVSNPGDDVELPQNLQWPRDGAFDDRGIEVEDDELPSRLTDAVAEYAARAIDPATLQARHLLADLPVEDEAGRRIKETFKKVGPLVTQTKFHNRSARKFSNYGNADEIMRKSGLIVATGERTVRV